MSGEGASQEVSGIAERLIVAAIVALAIVSTMLAGIAFATLVTGP